MKSTKFRLKNQKQKRGKAWLIVAGVLLIIISISGIYYLLHHDKQQQTSSEVDQAAQTGSAKKDTSKKGASAQDENLPENSSVTTPDQVPKSASARVTDLSFSQNGDLLSLGATFSGAESSGTCVFTLSAVDEKPVVKQVNSDVGHCSVTVSKFELSKAGLWTLGLVRYQGNEKVESSREVTIN